MTNKEIQDAIELYQRANTFHPFTCGGKNCNHVNLEGKILNDQIHLVCPQCGWIQTEIPEGIYSFPDDLRRMISLEKQGNVVFMNPEERVPELETILEDIYGG